MKCDVMNDSLLSAINADTGENKCGTVMLKPVFFITNHSCNIKMLAIRFLPEDTK